MSLGGNVKKLVKEIAARYKYMRGKKGVLENPHQDLKQWQPDGAWGKTGRVAGLAGIDLAWFLFCLMKYTAKDTRNALNTVFLNNIVIDKLEERNRKKKIKTDDSNFKKFFKNLQKSHPRAAATLQLWMVYTLMTLGIAGGKVAYDKKDYIKENLKEKFENFQHHDGEIEDLQLDPSADEDSWKQQVAAVHPYVVAHIFSSEGVILDSYDDNGGKGTVTVGAGFTIADQKHKNFAERILQRPVSESNFHVTKSEARLLTEAWLIEEIYPEIKRHFKKPMDYKLFVILSVAAYNKGEKIYRDGNSGQPVCDAVNSGRSKDDILHIYIRAFGGKEITKWSGLANKYAVCALYYADRVQERTILQAIAEAPYALEDLVQECQKNIHVAGMKKKRLLTYDDQGRVNGLIIPDSIENMLLETKVRTTKGSLQEPVMNYLSEDEVFKILHGYMFGVSQDFGTHLKSDDRGNDKPIKQNNDFEQMYNNALASYRQNKYEEAALLYEQLITLYPDNALIRNDLSATYNHLGKYNEAIKQSQDIVRRIADKSQYGAAQYNAGVAYENLGELDRALKNYKLSLTNGNTSAAKAIKRVQQKLSKKKSKKMAFDDGIMKIKAKQSTQGSIVYPFDNEHRV
ncbi:MAG: tetratricopeptide repeat protein [Alphaproteobacteria bacterium]|nr:tetratricopeptide repeat protein [Alphaproteobacteria bacterium]